MSKDRSSVAPKKTMVKVAVCLALFAVAAWIFCGVELLRADGKILSLAHAEAFFACLVLGGIAAALACVFLYVYLTRKDAYRRAEREMRICTCGAKVSVRFAFCPTCGKPLASDGAADRQKQEQEKE